MAPAHHLLTAAFGVCGLLFLLQVDSVNGLKCKKCYNKSPECDSGQVPEVECNSGAQCSTAVTYYKDGGIHISARDCTDGEELICFPDDSVMDERMILCDSDNCNSNSHDSYSTADKTGATCTPLEMFSTALPA